MGVWNKKEWKELRQKFLKDECELCGSKEAIGPHHLKQDGSYMFPKKQDIMTLCRRCHYLWKFKGVALCQVCRKQYHNLKYSRCYECSQKKLKQRKQQSQWEAEERKKYEENPICPSCKKTVLDFDEWVVFSGQHEDCALGAQD